MPITLPDNLFDIEKWKAFKGKYPPGSGMEHRIILGRIPEKVIKSIIFAICSSKTFDDKEKAMYAV
jgi:hypothetical protein